MKNMWPCQVWCEFWAGEAESKLLPLNMLFLNMCELQLNGRMAVMVHQHIFKLNMIMKD